jgi:hypothetical protein
LSFREIQSNEEVIDFFDYIDERGTISLLTPPHGPKMLTAVAGLGLESARDMLEAVRSMDADWIRQVQSQLAMFDEFNVDSLDDGWREMIDEADTIVHPAFRVIEGVTRSRSLVPGSLGLIVFNLKQRRIIQVHNSWDELERSGEGRYRVEGDTEEHKYSYSLPETWSLVP